MLYVLLAVTAFLSMRRCGISSDPICMQLMVARKQLGNLYEAISFTQIAIQFLKFRNA